MDFDVIDLLSDEEDIICMVRNLQRRLVCEIYLFLEIFVVEEFFFDSDFDEFEVLSYYIVFIVEVMYCFVSYVRQIDNEVVFEFFNFYEKLW